MLIIGCGTSLYAGQFAAHYFRQMETFNTVQCIESSEFLAQDVPLRHGGALFISQSGETKDVYGALKICKSKGLFTIGVINVVGSLIA